MKNNRTRRYIVMALAAVVAVTSVFAASPKYSFKLNGGIGAYNIGRNRYVEEVPGISDDINLDMKFDMKGNFSKEGNLKSTSYYSGAYLNVDKLYKNYSSSSKSSGQYDNKFMELQGMIDWYETNRHRYNLPEIDWQGFDYASDFINGSTVVPASDVLWTDDAWANAKILTEHIEDVINNKISHMFDDNENIPVGTSISQKAYQEASASDKRLMMLKLEAIDSFKKGVRRASYPVASAYVEFANVANLFDVRLNLGNARLNSGKLVTSARTGQGQYGSSLRFGLNKNVVTGLSAGLTVGVAGGERQVVENWDSRDLEYRTGTFAELGLMLDAAYTYEMEDLKLDITAGMNFLMPDLLVATGNNTASFRVGAHYNDFSEYIDSYGFYLVDPKTLAHEIEASDVFEFTYALTSDRYDNYDKKMSFAYGLKNEMYVSAYGAELKFDTSFKSAGFEEKWSRYSGDRFFGSSASSDYVNANGKSAALFSIDLAYDSFRLLNTKLFRVSAGFDGLVYGKKLIGTGFNVDLAINLVDYVKQDLILNGGVSYYANNLIPSFGKEDKDFNKAFMNHFTYHVGLDYAPAQTFKTTLEFVSAPSCSSVDTSRIMSAEARFTVSY